MRVQRQFTTTDVVFISDTHFDHANVINYCDRPFKFPETTEMNQVMLDGLIEADEAGKTIIHCGDLMFGNRFLKDCGWRPKGQHILILGNHDKHADEGGKYHSLYKELFSTIVGHSKKWRMNSYIVAVGTTRILLSHEPQRNLQSCHMNVYGHHHNNMTRKPDMFIKDYPWIFDDERYINVGVELTNYKPVTFDELKTLELPKRPV